MFLTIEPDELEFRSGRVVTRTTAAGQLSNGAGGGQAVPSPTDGGTGTASHSRCRLDGHLGVAKGHGNFTADGGRAIPGVDQQTYANRNASFSEDIQ